MKSSCGCNRRTCIEQVLDALGAEYRRLKAADGQHGNNPIEWRHGEPPMLELEPEDVLP